jgi:hypothetical protein
MKKLIEQRKQEFLADLARGVHPSTIERDVRIAVEAGYLNRKNKDALCAGLALALKERGRVNTCND